MEAMCVKRRVSRKGEIMILKVVLERRLMKQMIPARPEVR